jgi:hypothetical protein
MRLPSLALLSVLATAACHPSGVTEEIPDGAVICALSTGASGAGEPDAGPFEQCTPEYPTCSPPYPESPGFQCCKVQSLSDNETEVTCMPNDAAAYNPCFLVSCIASDASDESDASDAASE